MNILLISISQLPHLQEHSITLDLIHTFQKRGHKVYVICSDNSKGSKTSATLSIEAGCKVLRIKIGENKTDDWIKKGFTTICMPSNYIKAIKKYYSKITFDLVIYPTPPVTLCKIVHYIKKRDNAQSYLLLKDIFPQNAVDLGIMSKHGIKSIIYQYFRYKEKKLYHLSDHIGCMSPANVNYIIKHNPKINPKKVDVCPNSIEIQEIICKPSSRNAIRTKYEIPFEKTVFVYGGNLGRPQGVPFIIDCLKSQLNNEKAYFFIIGDGTEFCTLQNFFNEYHPANMKLMKRLPKEDYDSMIAVCDVGMVFLDYRFTIPNFPSRILSYMQAGLPVFACTDNYTDIGNVITDGKFGWWCESNNAEAFGKIINEICDKDLNLIGRNSYQYLINNYDVNDAYNKIIASL